MVTVKQIEDYLVEQVEKMESGDTSAMDGIIKIEAILQSAKEAKDQVRELVMTAVEDFGEKEFVYKGATFKKVPARKMHKFDHYEKWVGKNARLKALEKQMKAAAQAGGEILNEETGELIPQARIQFTKESYSVKFKPVTV